MSESEIQHDDGMNRARLAWLAVAAVVLVAFGIGYLLWASNRVDQDIAAREERAKQAIQEFEADASAASQDTPVDDAIQAPDTDTSGSAPLDLEEGMVFAIHRTPGEDYGRVVIRHDDGTRTLLERKCLRLHVAAARGICLSRDETVLVPAWSTTSIDAAAWPV